MTLLCATGCSRRAAETRESSLPPERAAVTPVTSADSVASAESAKAAIELEESSSHAAATAATNPAAINSEKIPAPTHGLPSADAPVTPSAVSPKPSTTADIGPAPDQPAPTRGTSRRLSVNRPLDFDRLERAIREKYQLDQLESGTNGFDALRQRADAGDADATFALGVLLAYGEDGASDPLLAADLFARAAAGGVARASAELGRLYLSGAGVAVDPLHAEQLFTAAWQAGDPEGAFQLASGLRLGLFREPDPALAQSYLVAAAEHGHIAAVRTLNWLMQKGELVAPEPRISAWLQAAAETGDTGALLDFARLALRAKDGETAFATLEAAAESGSTYALVGLMGLSRTTLRDPAARARLQELFELHAQKGGGAARLSYESLALLQGFETDQRTAAIRARGYFQSADTNRAKLAVQMLDQGTALRDVVREIQGLSDEAAYARQRQQSVVVGPSSPPQLVSVKNPFYPAELVHEKLSGEAVVSFVVQPDGSVTDVRALRATHPAFATAAVEAVAQWKFTPGMVDGEARHTRMQIPVQFRPLE